MSRHIRTNRTIRLTDAEVELLARAGRSVGVGWNTYMRQVAIQHARRLVKEDQLAELDAAAHAKQAAKVKGEPPLFKRPRRETQVLEAPGRTEGSHE